MLKNIDSGSSAVSNMENVDWIQRQTASPEARREYEQERLILWVTEAVAKAMEEMNRNKAELADRLETSRAHVTQVLSGSRNMTLRTLADLAWACDRRAVISMEPLREQAYISQPLHLVRSSKPRLVLAPESAETLRSEPADVERLVS